ncbi:hypothetical protein [Hamadaea tsunoensis]|uniref:hypothetical protein n=1 Tax=Hamadaea tsunoensis TaxID=53368 RepID=UPI00040386D2|nr:hypothetical protein [Hamadaea tsunoensis]
MKREWRRGSIALTAGYAIFNADGELVQNLADVQFALEGGFVNIRVAGRDDTQVVSAPALSLITCHTLGEQE